MRKLALATTATALILGLGTSAVSADQARGGKAHNHKQVEKHQTERHSDARRRGPAVETVKVGVHRRYLDETIPLRGLLGLDRDYRGYRIQSVVVKVRPNKTRARMALVANGRVVDRTRASHIRHVELTPRHGRTIGRDINQLQLAVRGRAYIDSIQVKLRAPQHKGRAPQLSRVSHDTHPNNPDLAKQIVRVIFGQIDLANSRH